jgi:hypothetical protein
MTYTPSEDLIEYADGFNIASYRLVDGSYIIAEEMDCDDENNVLYLDNVVELITDMKSGIIMMKPWLDSEENEFVRLAGDKIIGATETPIKYRLLYLKYLMAQRLQQIMDSTELESLNKELTYPPVDNPDLNENNSFYQPLSDIHSQWRKKFKDN